MLYFVEHTPVDPVRMTYSNGYQNARTGVGSKVLVFIRPCDPLWVHRGVFHKIACDFYFETEQVYHEVPQGLHVLTLSSRVHESLAYQ